MWAKGSPICVTEVKIWKQMKDGLLAGKVSGHISVDPQKQPNGGLVMGCHFFAILLHARLLNLP